ncbi:MAG: glycosyltransferase [Pirellula sp.]|nr:glycosyltransferase [Pirellula sp.]
MRTSSAKRVLMLLQNECYPEDTRPLQEAESLTKAGYKLFVICPTSKSHRKKSEAIGNIRVYRYPKPPDMGGVLGYCIEYAYSVIMQFVLTCYVALRHGFDAIHQHTPPDLMACIPVVFQLIGKKFVYDLHDLSPELFQAQRGNRGSRMLERVLLWFERLASSRADRLLATNETQRDVQIHRCGANASKCHIVRNGPSELFLTKAEPLPELVTLGKSIIGYVGVMGVQDGVDYLIRSLHHLRTVLGREDFHAVIVGDGPAVPDLKKLVVQLGLSDRVLFTGMVLLTDVPRYIASFDICSTPDPSNPYNDSCTTIKTMEYMAGSQVNSW